MAARGGKGCANACQNVSGTDSREETPDPTDGATPGSSYRLWTTLKVPQGYALEKHAVYVVCDGSCAKTFLR